jgi:protein-S-isoprenylcysteine O-methyltransferase Ste14/rhodanese-related sulfurtransferase
VAVVLTIGLTTGFSEDPGMGKFILSLLFLIPAGFLFFFSIIGLASYFIFIPSISHDAHIFAHVHGGQLLHPLTTALLVGLLGLCIHTGSLPGLGMWAVFLVLYIIQTGFMMARLRAELANNGLTGNSSTFLLLLGLVLGGELLTIAAGSKPLPPWRLNTLPNDTWVVDIRTKPEFKWNRIQSAENYPWGAGLIEAAASRPKDRPVLVTCLSGHRSPPFTIMLRRLGFTTVYNLNWGILYLALIERGRKTEGPFSLTRSKREANMRGRDFRGISIGYITFAVLTLIVAPLYSTVSSSTAVLVLQIAGGIIGLLGLGIGILSYVALGRNFRVFAAPRRSGTLITTGIYKSIRHPMYTAVVTALGGYVLAFGSVYAAPFWFGCALLYLIKGFKEEQLLQAHYPEYEEYRKRTWMFIPYVL